MILVPAALTAIGALITLMLPEPSQSTLEEISDDPLGFEQKTPAREHKPRRTPTPDRALTDNPS